MTHAPTGMQGYHVRALWCSPLFLRPTSHLLLSVLHARAHAAPCFGACTMGCDAARLVGLPVHQHPGRASGLPTLNNPLLIMKKDST